jgi:hypothetical protein
MALFYDPYSTHTHTHTGDLIRRIVAQEWRVIAPPGERRVLCHIFSFYCQAAAAAGME